MAAVRGSGPEGAVLAADVTSATEAPSAPATHLPVASGAAEAPGSQPTIAGPHASAAPQLSSPSAPASRAWRVMAERMAQAWTTIPHFALLREVEATALRDMRARIGPAVAKRSGAGPTYTDLLVKLIAVALGRQPRINSSWRDGAIVQHAEINIGLAVASDDALVVPVIHRADEWSIGEIGEQRRALVERASAGKLSPADLSGGTFTLSNLGMYGVDAFSAIVNPPQAAILAVGRIADRVLAVDGQPVVRPTVILTLSCDHRAIDGARAAQFLDELVGLIEEPWGLLA